MTFAWLKLRRKRRRQEKPREPSEEDTNLLRRIAAGIALNKFPPR